MKTLRCREKQTGRAKIIIKVKINSLHIIFHYTENTCGCKQKQQKLVICAETHCIQVPLSTSHQSIIEAVRQQCRGDQTGLTKNRQHSAFHDRTPNTTQTKTQTLALNHTSALLPQTGWAVVNRIFFMLTPNICGKWKLLQKTVVRTQLWVYCTKVSWTCVLHSIKTCTFSHWNKLELFLQELLCNFSKNSSLYSIWEENICLLLGQWLRSKMNKTLCKLSLFSTTWKNKIPKVLHKYP